MIQAVNAAGPEVNENIEIEVIDVGINLTNPSSKGRNKSKIWDSLIQL
jgi:hypothetical protein